jgi:hypothetical protein
MTEGSGSKTSLATGLDGGRSGQIALSNSTHGGWKMAELTNLESKLGEVTGLAMAAQVATGKVMKLADGEDSALVAALEKMREEAAETERRCTDLAGTFDGKKTAILDEARATKGKGADMLEIYLDQESDALDGFEFLTMCEAGEVGHWEVLRQLNSHAGHAGVGELVQWALPIQQRHFEGALAGSKTLAASEDPNETA